MLCASLQDTIMGVYAYTESKGPKERRLMTTRVTDTRHPWTAEDYALVDREPFFLAGNTGKIPNVRNWGQNPGMAPGVVLCNAARRSEDGRDKRCSRPVDKYGNGRCPFHGGHAAAGVAASGFKHGRDMKPTRYGMPAHLHEVFERALEDKDFLSLRENVAVLDARAQELLDSLPEGGARPALRRVKKLLKEAQGDDEPGPLIEQALAELDAMSSYDERWREIRATTQERRQLVESENRRIIAEQATITPQQFATVLATLGASVRENVTDPQALRAIHRDIARLLGSPTDGEGRAPTVGAIEAEVV
jgi:hypothetical protein